MTTNNATRSRHKRLPTPIMIELHQRLKTTTTMTQHVTVGTLVCNDMVNVRIMDATFEPAIRWPIRAEAEPDSEVGLGQKLGWEPEQAMEKQPKLRRALDTAALPCMADTAALGSGVKLPVTGFLLVCIHFSPVAGEHRHLGRDRWVVQGI